MNIFITDPSPIISAQTLCDAHVRKQVVETVQMLVSALNRHDINHDVKTKNGDKHRGGYSNHPCTRWAGDTITNARWLLLHGLSIALEYSRRYGKQHACYSQLRAVEEVIDQLPAGPLTAPALAMPDQCKTNNTFESYRNAIRLKVAEKPNSFVWVKDPSRKPAWLALNPSQLHSS